METPTPPSAPNRGSNNAYQTIDEKLKIVKIAIDNAQVSPELSVALATKGYGSASLQAAATLYQKAEKLHLEQKRKYGDKSGATDNFDALREEVDENYSDHLGLARIVLKNKRGDLEKLQANGRRKDTISGWMGQAKAFYTNALESADIKAALATKGITEAELTDSQTRLLELEKREAAKYNTKGEAQGATADRDNAIDELLDWHKDFVDTARIALRKTPQLLEKLGISAKK